MAHVKVSLDGESRKRGTACLCGLVHLDCFLGRPGRAGSVGGVGVAPAAPVGDVGAGVGVDS